tara:strand:+ start:37 stop:486 length:450 start_codon:yes stop_codon:yes gene_type:complete
MDYLYKKSDSSFVAQGRIVTKIKLPGQTNGDVVFCGADKRPLDLGDYWLIRATHNIPKLNSFTKLGPKTEVLDAEKLTVTIKQNAINKTPEELWLAIRGERNYKLKQSDWRGMSDAPTMSDAWTDYRQALRDVTSQSDPKKITWPSEPS